MSRDVSESTDPGARPVTRPPTALDALAESHFTDSLALDPIAATFAGVSGHDDRLTDYSPDGHQARADQLRHTLAAVQAIDGVDAVDSIDTVTAATLRERLGQQLAEHDAGLDLAALNNVACPVQGLREVFDVAPAETEQDWEAIAARLTAMPAALDGYRASLRRAVDGGWRPAVRQVRAASHQAREFGAADGFFVTLAAGAPAEVAHGALERHLTAGAERAAAAYVDLADWLDSDVASSARADDAVGRDVYALVSPGFLGTAVDLDQTYAWGLEELARVERRMAEVAGRLAPDATGDVPERIAAAIAALDADPARRIEGAEAFRDWMQDLSDSAVDRLGRDHFDIPEPVRELRCRIAPSTSGAVYYTPPGEDFSRPGQMWWSVPAGVTSFATWHETSTVYHEGVPGHHLQCGQTVYRADRLNRWRRLGVWVSGHGEGWALYAERLMEELGFLQDAGDLMGMLDAHALRAARVVVDIGVHCGLTAPTEVGGGVWDAEKAWQFLITHTRVPHESLRFELDRYLGWPGQAISYKVGERAWLELRDQAQAREGAAFELKAFHRRALDLGSVGLDVLRDALTD